MVALSFGEPILLGPNSGIHINAPQELLHKRSDASQKTSDLFIIRFLCAHLFIPKNSYHRVYMRHN